MNPQNQPTVTTTAHTPRRRMRRTGRARCPQRAAQFPKEKCQMLDAQCSMNSPTPSASSASPALKTETKPKRHRARPFQTLPEFAALDHDQLAYIHDILRTKTLEDAQREIWTELGLQTRLDLCTLHRYKHKVLFAESLDLVDDATTAVDQLNDLLAGRETKIPAAGMAVVQQRALALANDPKTKPSLFTNLHRIFTYEDRREENCHRLALADQREATRKEMAEERKAMNAHKRALDLEKFKLAQQREQNRHQLATERLALDTRKQAHREKVAAAKIPNPNLDEEARLRAEGFLEIGRQVVARRRLAQSTTEITGGAHSTMQASAHVAQTSL